eukprot:8920121-Lingulodinium_polyedra.AAC.1
MEQLINSAWHTQQVARLQRAREAGEGPARATEVPVARSPADCVAGGVAAPLSPDVDLIKALQGAEEGGKLGACAPEPAQ